MWRPKTYQDYLNSIPLGEEVPIQLPEKERPNLEPRYRCDSCNIPRDAFELVDCRHLTATSKNWVCGGCWSSWMKSGEVFDGGSPITDRSEWLERWVTIHGAPQEVKDHMANRPRHPIIKSKVKGVRRKL